jgi:ligand-binding SRPBCC domain-containing protein
MSVHVIQRVQKIPVTLEKAWDFFSSPENLKKITPEYMGFNIIAVMKEKKAYSGQIITYKVSPLFHIPLYWMTEITQVKEQEYFVDEQRIGPYSLWHHQHHFKAINGGIEMTDIVHYKIPLGPIGELANRLFIKKRLTEIFDYRAEKTIKLFGEFY